MFAVVQFRYTEGRRATRANQVVGQVLNDWIEGVPVVHLWPIDFKRDCRERYVPQATLWHYVLVGVSHGTICLRGMELVQHGTSRRWCAQKWLCDIHDSQSAQRWLKRDWHLRAALLGEGQGADAGNRAT